MAIRVREDIVENDAAMAADTMNTLIRYIYEINPSLGENRPEFILFDPKDIDKARAERDSMLLNTNKIRLTKKYFVDNYDFGDEDIEVTEDAERPDQAEFAADRGARDGSFQRAAETPNAPYMESPRPAVLSANEYQEAVDVLADGIQDDAVQTQVEGLLKPVFELVNNASTFEEVAAGLDSLYADMDESAVAETAEKLAFLGDTWGRLSNGGEP